MMLHVYSVFCMGCQESSQLNSKKALNFKAVGLLLVTITLYKYYCKFVLEEQRVRGTK